MDPPRSLRPGAGGGPRPPQNGYATNDRDWRREDPRERQRDDKQQYSNNGLAARPNRSQTRDPHPEERERSRGGDGGRSRDKDRSRQNGMRGTRRLDGRLTILGRIRGWRKG